MGQNGIFGGLGIQKADLENRVRQFFSPETFPIPMPKIVLQMEVVTHFAFKGMRRALGHSEFTLGREAVLHKF